MWQSAGKYVPRVDQLVKVAPAIIEMGCFARVETNGGGFEQVNLLFGENPNRAVREWTKPFHEAGIQTHMLDRALNGLRMSPVPADVRKLFYKVKESTRHRYHPYILRIERRTQYRSFHHVCQRGRHDLTVFTLHHPFADPHGRVLHQYGVENLSSWGGRDLHQRHGRYRPPVSLGKIVANIKAAHPEIPIQYHSHAGPGFNMASILEVCEAGCDYIDVGMEPLSWGTGHADLLSVQAMLKDAGYQVPEINMEAHESACADSGIYG